MTPEGKLKAACRRIAKAAGLFWANVQGKQINGLPDTIVGHTDLLGVIWIEFKRPGKEPTEQQYQRIGELRAAGERADWCDNVERFKQLVGLA